MWSLALCPGETPPGDGGLTWVHLAVAGNSVRVDNVLEPRCEGVEREQGGWRRGGGQAVVERVDTAATFPLMGKKWKLWEHGLTGGPWHQTECDSAHLPPPLSVRSAARAAWRWGTRPQRSGTCRWPTGCRDSAPSAPPCTSARAPSTGAARPPPASAPAAGRSPSAASPAGQREVRVGGGAMFRNKGCGPGGSSTLTDRMSSILTASPCRISSRSVGLSG